MLTRVSARKFVHNQCSTIPFNNVRKYSALVSKTRKCIQIKIEFVTVLRDSSDSNKYVENNRMHPGQTTGHVYLRPLRLSSRMLQESPFEGHLDLFDARTQI